MIYTRRITICEILFDGASYAKYFTYVTVNDWLPFFTEFDINYISDDYIAWIVREKRAHQCDWFQQKSREKRSLRKLYLSLSFSFSLPSFSSLLRAKSLLSVAAVYIHHTSESLRSVFSPRYVRTLCFHRKYSSSRAYSLSFSLPFFVPTVADFELVKIQCIHYRSNFSERSDPIDDTKETEGISSWNSNDRYSDRNFPSVTYVT